MGPIVLVGLVGADLGPQLLFEPSLGLCEALRTAAWDRLRSRPAAEPRPIRCQQADNRAVPDQTPATRHRSRGPRVGRSSCHEPADPACSRSPAASDPRPRRSSAATSGSDIAWHPSALRPRRTSSVSARRPAIQRARRRVACFYLFGRAHQEPPSSSAPRLALRPAEWQITSLSATEGPLSWDWTEPGRATGRASEGCPSEIAWWGAEHRPRLAA
jgi:hypothetical protein